MAGDDFVDVGDLAFEVRGVPPERRPQRNCNTTARRCRHAFAYTGLAEGVLTVRVPKSERAQRKKIAITGS